MPRPDRATEVDFNDEDSNRSGNAHFEHVLRTRLNRRHLLRAAGALSATGIAPLALTACGGDDDEPAPAPQPAPQLLGFTAVAKGVQDSLVVPAGYTASVVYALGDPLRAATADFRNDGTDDDFDHRAGDHHDGMEWFGLGANGAPSVSAGDRGLLAINHEATTDERLASFFLHPTGGTATLPRPAAEVDKETAIHGVSVVEVRRATDGRWNYVRDSAFNFRVTALTSSSTPTTRAAAR